MVGAQRLCWNGVFFFFFSSLRTQDIVRGRTGIYKRIRKIKSAIEVFKFDFFAPIMLVLIPLIFWEMNSFYKNNVK
jgi:hypothetical protein